MNSLDIKLFGSPSITLDQDPLTDFRTRKVQALLFFLITEPGAHERTDLLEFLWPGLPEKSARSNLRQILYYLRQAIPAAADAAGEETDILVANRKDIQLNPQAQITADVTLFESLLSSTHTHEHVDILLCPECREQLETAVELYRGHFLHDFYLNDSDEFEQWAQAKRDYFRYRVLDALDILANIAIRRAEYSAAEIWIEQQLSIDNLRESAYRQMMELYGLNGHKEQVKLVYERYARTLFEEYGMVPSARTTEFYERISRGEIPPFNDQKKEKILGYELKESIGEGAYGEVHRAVQSAVARDVAIKVIRSKYADEPEFIRRFEAEAQTVARLEHPYIVPLYDYWRDPQGAYLVMRYMRGGSLLDALTDGAWTAEKTADMLDQIAAALQSAHQQGVIHRDLKPGNILLDEEGNAYLADFGIAKDLKQKKPITLQGNGMMGTLDYASPEQITGGGVSPQTDIYSLGAVLYEILTGERPFPDSSISELLHSQLNEPIPLVTATRPDISPDVDEVLQRATAKSPDERFGSVLDMALAFRRALGLAHQTKSVTFSPDLPLVAAEDIYNPFKGLYAFQESDAKDFFGREMLTQQLISRLGEEMNGQANRFLALVGPSGSGKSSVIKAGLLPALRQEGLKGSSQWFFAEMVPGANPFDELELALWRIAVDPPANLAEPMKRDTGGILRTIRRILPDQGGYPYGQSQLVLVIDQFEELYTLTADAEEREFFLESLLTAIQDPKSPLRVIVTLRADYYDRPLQHPVWGPLLRENTEVILPLNRTELTWAVREPLHRLGIRLDDALTGVIVDDVIDQPGSLPLLQYALTEMFERREGRVISQDLYEQIGGVQGALGQRAELVYSQLSTADQHIARQIFLRLITLGEGSGDTRRRAFVSELESLEAASDGDANSVASSHQIQQLLSIFGRARFFTFDRDPLTRAPTVEVAHEALLREWKRLGRWLQETREDIRQQRRLANATTEWLVMDQDNGYLLQGARLAQFESWRVDSHIALTQDESLFLSRSIETHVERIQAEQLRQQRELETAQKLAETEAQRAHEQEESAQSLRRRSRYLAIAAGVAFIFAVLALWFGQSASQNATLAEQNAAVAVTAEAEAEQERDVAVAAQATSEANAMARATAEVIANLEREQAVQANATTQAESIIRATAEAEAIRNEERAEEQLDLTTSRELALAANANLDIDPELSILLSLSAIDSAKTSEAEQALRAALQEARGLGYLAKADDDIQHVLYHPNGEWRAGLSRAGQLIIWDIDSDTVLQAIPLGEGPYDDMEVSSDGALLAMTIGGGIQLVSTENWQIQPGWQASDTAVFDIEFSPDGALLASGDKAGGLKIWRIADQTEQFAVQASDFGWINDVSFSSDGTRIVTAGDDLTARVLDVSDGAELYRIEHNDALWIHNAMFSADGAFIYSVPGNNSEKIDVIVWQIEGVPAGTISEPLYNWYSMHGNLLTKMKLSQDGAYVITASQDNTIKLWDATANRAIEVMTLSGHNGLVNDFAIHPNGEEVMSASLGEVRLWNSTREGIGELLNIPTAASPIDFTPDGSRLITSESDRFRTSGSLVSIWDTQTGNLLAEFDSGLPSIKAYTVSDDGRWLALGGDDDVVKIFQLDTLQEYATFLGHNGGITGFVHPGILGIDFDPSAERLVTAGADGYAIVWDIESGEQLWRWRVHPENAIWVGYEEFARGLTNAQFSPDGRWVAVSTDESDPLVKIYDTVDGSEYLALSGFGRRIWGMDFSPDGSRLLLAGGGGVAQIWDVTTGELAVTLAGVGTTIVFAEFTGDGNSVLTSGDDVILWDVATGQRILKFPNGLWSLAVAEDQQRLALSDGERLYLYTMDFADLLTAGEGRLTREFTDAECQQYLRKESCVSP